MLGKLARVSNRNNGVINPIYFQGTILNKLLFLLYLIVVNVYARDIPSDSLIQGRLNIVNGASAECVMHQFYIQSGWTQIKGGIGRHGIEGLYYKNHKAISIRGSDSVDGKHGKILGVWDCTHIRWR